LQDLIPERVFRAIQKHLRDRTALAERGWLFSAFDPIFL
jgi:hypothetical protein